MLIPPIEVQTFGESTPSRAEAADLAVHDGPALCYHPTIYLVYTENYISYNWICTLLAPNHEDAGDPEVEIVLPPKMHTCPQYNHKRA